jgi:hypothetical protein
MAQQQDYSFMQSGSGATTPQMNINENEIRQLLSLFISNAIINASRYAKLCKRNGVTKSDINLGLKYEMREFFERSTLKEDFEEIVKDYEDLKNEEAVMYKVEYVDTRTGIITESGLFDDEDKAEEFICELEQTDYFTDFTIVELTQSDMMMDDMVVEDELIQEFTKITTQNLVEASQEDRLFVSKIHRYESEWETWEPDTPIKAILKNGAIKMMETNF